MSARQPSQKAARAALVADLRGEGRTWVEIAAVLRDRYRVNGRVALRMARGWSQGDVAALWNARWPDEPKTFKNISSWELWPATTGHAPSFDALARLAELYECGVTDLLVDHPDYRYLDSAYQPSDIAPASAPPVDEDSVSGPGLRPSSGGLPTSRLDGRIAPSATAEAVRIDAENRERGLLAATGMDTLEVISRLRHSDVSASTLDALRVVTERLCSEYRSMRPERLCAEGHGWLSRLAQLREKRLTLAQHREVLVIAGWMTLLVGCVEYDMRNERGAEATRQAALSLGEEAGHPEIVGWAHEMQAWYALTHGHYRGVIAASERGQLAAPRHSVSVQLTAQKAKAWARIGDRRQVEAALEEGRTLLDSLPCPENLDNHFVVDPAKYDFYAMDCYRVLGEDQLAESFAHQVIAAGTDFDGHETSPMRNAEARVTLGVVALRGGDLDEAVVHGRDALNGGRKSLPSLLMASRELAMALHHRDARNADVDSYLDQLRAVSSGVAT